MTSRAAAITVVAPSSAPVPLDRITQTLTSLNLTIRDSRALVSHPFNAYDIDIEPDAADLAHVREALAGQKIPADVLVIPEAMRHGRVAYVMDVDSTFIVNEVIELIAAHAGTQDQVAAVTERAMRGELDFAASLRERVATLAGVPLTAMLEVLEQVRFTPGARTLVATLRARGDVVGLVSGGFMEVLEPLIDGLGIEHVRANRLAVRDGVLTGEVSGPIVDRAAKAVALREYAAAAGVPSERTVAIGDGANDLDMLSAAGLGIAFNAKPLVQQQADATLNVPHLDAALTVLGLDASQVCADPADDPWRI